jgi:hypothetical protein
LSNKTEIIKKPAFYGLTGTDENFSVTEDSSPLQIFLNSLDDKISILYRMK